MPEPYTDLPEKERQSFLSDLRSVLSEPDPEQAARARRDLVARVRERHPDLASWLESDTQAAGPEAEPSVLDGLDVSRDRVAALKGRRVLVKYGGNAMVDEERKQAVIADICALKSLGALPVVVHGGGPVISELLGEVGVESLFVEGHRKTDRDTMGYVEMALSGKVNSEIVKLIGCHGFRAVGISGKDGGLVTATKRIHTETTAGHEKRTDLGQVGDVSAVDTHLLMTLLDGGYIPVVAPIGVGRDLEDYNINADMFAGHLAAALDAAAFVALTDVPGVFVDRDDPETLVPTLSSHAARAEIGRIVQGGMIPKVESCLIALEGGVPEARIISGMADRALLKALLTPVPTGTTIRGSHE